MSTVDWAAWARRWDLQQGHHIARHEERFAAMLELVAEVAGDERPLRLMDLACGPGAITRRALTRFPTATVLGVDADPFLLAIAERSVGDGEGRVSFVRTDLRDPRWTDTLGDGSFDAVLSSTALHWLPVGDLVRLYRDLAGVIRPGGLFLNADHQTASAPESTLSLAARSAGRKLSAAAVAAQTQSEHLETWEQWWAAAHAEPAFAELLAERAQLFHDHPHEPPLSASFHEEALRLAGFADVAVVWRWFDDAVLAAVR
jgi:trans-aconitate methyltransferase